MFKSRRIKISVRVLMLLILIVGILLGWRANKARRQRAAAAAVEKYGGWVHYDYEFVPGPGNLSAAECLHRPLWGTLSLGKSPSAPAWLRRTLGDDYFQEIAQVSLLGDTGNKTAGADPLNIGGADGVIAKLAGQTGIRTLQIGGQHLTDRSMASIGQMTSLEELVIFPASEITDAGLAHLLGLNNLKVLFMTDSMVVEAPRFSDRALTYLKGMKRLRTLWIRQDQDGMTDAGVASLAGLHDLETLDLVCSKVTDEGLQRLRGLTKLTELRLRGSKTTKEGRERFKTSMPNLTYLE
jgi:hypothetical protein